MFTLTLITPSIQDTICIAEANLPTYSSASCCPIMLVCFVDYVPFESVSWVVGGIRIVSDESIPPVDKVG